MKAVTIISVLLLIFGCNNDQFDQCKKENERLIAAQSKQDSVLDAISGTYSSIDSISMLISEKRAAINEMARKGKLSAEDKAFILAEMDTINILMSENENKVADLNSGLNQEGLEEGFRYVIQGLDDKNESEDIKLHSMKQELATVSRDFSDLFEDYVYKEAENIEMREELSSKAKELEEAQKKLDMAKEKLRSGWYVIGTHDELKEKGLVYKKGFFDNKEINEDFDKSQFKKVDIHDLKEIILDAKKAEIMTTHPSESYEMVGIKRKVNKLVIKDPDLFWSVSKFLIIEIES